MYICKYIYVHVCTFFALHQAVQDPVQGRASKLDMRVKLAGMSAQIMGRVQKGAASPLGPVKFHYSGRKGFVAEKLFLGTREQYKTADSSHVV